MSDNLSNPVEKVASAIREADFYAKRPDHYYEILARAAVDALELRENRAGRYVNWSTPTEGM